MTNKEAIKILQNDGCCQDCTFGGYPCKLVGCETHQALDLAIKVLEQMELIKFNIYALRELTKETEND